MGERHNVIALLPKAQNRIPQRFGKGAALLGIGRPLTRFQSCRHPQSSGHILGALAIATLMPTHRL